MPKQRLPAELWLEVFQWATFTSSDAAYTTNYKPFEPLGRYEVLDQSLKVKAVVVRVCRQWRALAEYMLYEDLRIRHGEQALADVLESCEERGRWVRRAELPYTNTVTTTPSSLRPLPFIAILKRCPELEILVRPVPRFFDKLPFEFDAEGLPLTSLKRLEWWNSNEATRSGGINSLDEVLSCTPNLQYLLIGGERWMSQRAPPLLPSLTTLRLRWMNNQFIQQICQWSLPALSHVIIDNSHCSAVLEMLWETFGSQIRIVEFGKHVRFYIEDHITPLLRVCPSLQELNYHIYFTVPPHSVIKHSSIHSVRLHGNVNLLATDGDWEHISCHFAWFYGPSLPSLERIILYGEWSAILTDNRFNYIHCALVTRKCALERPDGTVIQVTAG
jgi:hypothetical protein